MRQNRVFSAQSPEELIDIDVALHDIIGLIYGWWWNDGVTCMQIEDTLGEDWNFSDDNQRLLRYVCWG